MSTTFFRSFIRLSVFFFVVVLYSCKKEGGLPSPTILNKNTYVVSGQTNALLVNVTADKLVFQGDGGQLSNVVSGDVVVSEPTLLAPAGYLRKVVTVSKGNGSVTLFTESATLEDAINECDFTSANAFSINDTLTGKQEQATFESTVDITLYDKDGNSATINDRIALTGSYKIDPSLLFNLKIRNAQIKHLKMGLGLSETVDIRLNANLISATLLEDEVPLASYALAPIVVWVGHFPIVVRPVIKLLAGHETGINAEVSAGWSGSAYQEAYLEYNKNAGWNVASDKWMAPGVVSNTLSGSVSSEAYLKAEMQFILYDFEDISASIYGKSYVDAEGTCTVTPSGLEDCGWTIRAGYKAGGDLSAEVFGHSLLNYSAEIFDMNHIVYQSTPAQNGKIPMNISNVQSYFTDVNTCWMDEISDYGSPSTMTFDIDEPGFNPYQYFEIRTVGYFSSGTVDYDYLNANSVGVSVVDYNTIQINWCTRFGNADYVDMELVLLNDAYQSNPVSIHITRPPGAYKNESGTPATKPRS